MVMAMGIFHRRQSLDSSGVLRGTTDCHSHILYGVDDGVRTIEEALAVLKYHEMSGVADVWCTPHVMEDMENETEGLKRRFEDLQAAYEGPVRLHLAAEYMLDTVFEKRLEARDLLTMGEDMVLVETSTGVPPIDMADKFCELQRAGYVPLFAHPERYRYLDEADYVRLRKMGVRFQLNLPSLVGFYGDTAMRKAEWLLENAHYACAGSDCHRNRLICEQYERKVLSKKCLESLRALLDTGGSRWKDL